MATGKLTPRQKMINMMYLIFIAMMAMNMSKEVLSAFGLLNERLTESNTASDIRIAAFMENLGNKASEQPEQYGAVKQKADQINSLSQEFDSFLADVKRQLDEKSKIPADDMNNYEIKVSKDFLDQILCIDVKLINL